MTNNPSETWLTRSQQARRFGVTKRTIERWGQSEDLGLPPEIEIRGRHYRKLSALAAWERARVVASIPKSAERECTAEADEADPPPPT